MTRLGPGQYDLFISPWFFYCAWVYIPAYCSPCSLGLSSFSLQIKQSCQTLLNKPYQNQRTAPQHRQHLLHLHQGKFDLTLVRVFFFFFFLVFLFFVFLIKLIDHDLFIGTQYQVLDVVGEGAYGIVCSAVHRPSGCKVAIKKITPFEHSMFCLRTLRELKLLKFLSEAGVSENVCFFFSAYVYLVFH